MALSENHDLQNIHQSVDDFRTMLARFMLLAALVCVAAPAVAAPMGTEMEPELHDPEGDVEYSPADLQKSSGFIDLSAGWFDHNATYDEIVYHLRVADSTALANSQPEGSWRCESGFELFGAEAKTGSMSVQWSKSNGATTIVSAAALARGSGAPTAGDYVKFDHRFAFTTAEPGYFEWGIPRAYIQNLADELRTLRAICTEIGYIGDIPNGVRNSDDAAAQSDYKLEGVAPSGKNPEETAEGAAPGGGTPSDTAGATVAVPFVLVALVLASVALAKRR